MRVAVHTRTSLDTFYNVLACNTHTLFGDTEAAEAPRLPSATFLDPEHLSLDDFLVAHSTRHVRHVLLLGEGSARVARFLTERAAELRSLHRDQELHVWLVEMEPQQLTRGFPWLLEPVPPHLFKLPHRITRGLFLGDYASSRCPLLPRLVRRVVNASGGMRNTHEGVLEYLQVEVMDEAREARKLQGYLEEVAAFVARSEEPVLIHCAAGVSRSVTLVLACLMLNEGWTLKRAWRHTKAIRSVCDPNPGFVRVLLELEERLRPGQTSAEAVAGQNLELLSMEDLWQ